MNMPIRDINNKCDGHFMMIKVSKEKVRIKQESLKFLAKFEKTKKYNSKNNILVNIKQITMEKLFKTLQLKENETQEVQDTLETSSLNLNLQPKGKKWIFNKKKPIAQWKSYN